MLLGSIKKINTKKKNDLLIKIYFACIADGSETVDIGYIPNTSCFNIFFT
jgi:hypothetical protein